MNHAHPTGILYTDPALHYLELDLEASQRQDRRTLRSKVIGSKLSLNGGISFRYVSKAPNESGWMTQAGDFIQFTAAQMNLFETKVRRLLQINRPKHSINLDALKSNIRASIIDELYTLRQAPIPVDNGFGTLSVPTCDAAITSAMLSYTLEEDWTYLDETGQWFELSNNQLSWFLHKVNRRNQDLNAVYYAKLRTLAAITDLPMLKAVFPSQ